ncbi:hypothetical protein BGX34_000116 [Mortierella sp. NVP85]|nr:hypothetical protein BGX34_000116 [Mortierella sp. NVP85]
MPDDPSNPFLDSSNHETPHSTISSKYRRSGGIPSAEGFRGDNPFLDQDDINRLWEDQMGGQMGMADGEMLEEDTRDLAQGDMTDPFMDSAAMRDGPIYIGDITNASYNIPDGLEATTEDADTGVFEDYQFQGSRTANDRVQGGSLNDLNVIDLAGEGHQVHADSFMNEVNRNLAMNDRERQNLVRIDGDISPELTQSDARTDGQEPALEDEDRRDYDDVNMNVNEDHTEQLERVDGDINGQELTQPDARSDEREPVLEDEDQRDYEDGYMNVNDEDHIEQLEHEEQQDRPGVHYFDDFPSELGIMSNGNVLPTSAPAPKKTDVTRWASSTIDAICPSEAARSYVFKIKDLTGGDGSYPGRAANDLAAYAEHAGRKTIDESDVECLMGR